jgi:hypothetical protein
VFIGEGTVVEDGAMIKGPAIIGKNCQIRHNAYIREHVIVGDGCVVGNSCELKNVLLFNGCQVPHFNYLGDSILGYKAHVGAGVIASNLKSLPGNVTVEMDGKPFDTGLRKFGALVGDGAEVGCNSVLEPRQHHWARRGDLSRRELARFPAREQHREEPAAGGSCRAPAARILTSQEVPCRAPTPVVCRRQPNLILPIKRRILSIARFPLAARISGANIRIYEPLNEAERGAHFALTLILTGHW